MARNIKAAEAIVSLYLVAQGAVDLADKWNQPNQTLDGTTELDIAPEKE